MNILTNFPFEMFGPRQDLPFEQVVTWGPREGRQVGERHFTFDVAFDAREGSLDELMALLPPGFTPDVLLLWWPDQEAIPDGLERAPVPVVGVFSDYNLTLPYVRGTWPFFDLVLCDRPGLGVLGRMPFARVEPWCQYSFRPDEHRPWGDERDIDIAFVGNLNPVVQRERAPWLDRVRALESDYRVFVGNAEHGEAYGRVLARSRIAFNRSVRGEVNLRAFEAAACGAMLMMERENTEVRDWFTPGEDVVLYGADDFESLVKHYLRNEDERARIAANGYAKVQRYRLADHCAALPPLFRSLDPARRPRPSEATLLHGRSISLLAAPGALASTLRALVRAADLDPSAPILNDLAAASVQGLQQLASADSVGRLLQLALAADPTHLPAHLNLAWLYENTDQASAACDVREAGLRCLDEPLPFSSFDGLCLPLGFSQRAVSFAGAWCSALRDADVAALAAWFRQELAPSGSPFALVP